MVHPENIVGIVTGAGVPVYLQSQNEVNILRSDSCQDFLQV